MKYHVSLIFSINFQYFVVTLRLFVLTRDKDLRSENETSVRWILAYVTSFPTRSGHFSLGTGAPLLISKPFAAVGAACPGIEHCAAAQRQTARNPSKNHVCFIFSTNFQYFVVTLRLFASGNVTDFESENESSVR